MKFLADGGSGRGDDLVIVLHLFALVHQGFSLGFAAFINQHRRHLQDGFGVEIVLRIGYGHLCVHIAGNGLENHGGALHGNIFSLLGHFLGRGAGSKGQSQDCRCKNSDSFFHISH